MLAGSVVVAGVAVFGCSMMATMASVSAQQIGNSQGQPFDALSPTRANPAPLVIACSGAFARDSHHLKLAMTYDRKNVDFGEVDAGPGKSMASIIYPNDPKRRLEVWWSDVDKRKDLYLIAINGSSTWTGPGGLRLGLSLAGLEKLNRKPFKLRGFDKDNTATVSDWDHGALAALSGGCKAGVILRTEAKAPPEVLAALPRSWICQHAYNNLSAFAVLRWPMFRIGLRIPASTNLPRLEPDSLLGVRIAHLRLLGPSCRVHGSQSIPPNQRPSDFRGPPSAFLEETHDQRDEWPRC